MEPAIELLTAFIDNPPVPWLVVGIVSGILLIIGISLFVRVVRIAGASIRTVTTMVRYARTLTILSGAFPALNGIGAAIGL